jgi:hypothetical protein
MMYCRDPPPPRRRCTLAMLLPLVVVIVVVVVLPRRASCASTSAATTATSAATTATATATTATAHAHVASASASVGRTMSATTNIDSSFSICPERYCETHHLSSDLILRYNVHLPPNFDLRSLSYSEGGDDDDDDIVPNDCPKCKLSVQLEYDGYGWVGFGVSDATGNMVGNVAVIGMPGLSEPRRYHLGGKDPSLVVALDDDNANDDAPPMVEGGSVDYVDGRTVIDFTTSFESWETTTTATTTTNTTTTKRMRPRGPTTFIWAHGRDGEANLGYHGPTRKSSHVIRNIATPSSSSSSPSDSMGMGEGSTTALLTTTAMYMWIAHGALAFVAWGMLVPLAMSIAISSRDVPPPSLGRRAFVNYVGVDWLRLHVRFNVLACAITIFVFAFAVINVHREGSDHFDNGHSKVGLAMLALCLHQVIGGMLRPSKGPMSSKSSHHGDVRRDDAGEEGRPMDEVGIENEDVVVIAGGGNGPRSRNGTPPMTSIARQSWELLHKGLGMSLFFLGTWQMHEGMTLYHERYDNSSYVVVVGLYLAWMAIWIVAVVGGIVRRWRLSSYAAGDAAVEGREKGMDTEMETLDANTHDDVPSDGRSVGVISMAGMKKMTLNRDTSAPIDVEDHVFL